MTTKTLFRGSLLTSRILFALFAAALLIIAGVAQSSGPGALAQCGPNAVVCENQNTGAPASEWDVAGAGDPSLQGFATDISVNRGQTVHFKVKTDSTGYQIAIYRMGYYGGLGARRIAEAFAPSATLPQTQPACLTDSTTGLIDCGSWAESAAWLVPETATSGIYFARLSRPDTGGASHIFFVVRDDAGTSDLLFQTSDTTWQAYNEYGGNSLYVGSPNRAYKVSYNRPLTTRGTTPANSVFNAEYPMVRWLEANGYDVSYVSGVDTDRSGAVLLNKNNHRVFLSVGHDEYWSGAQRTNVENARAAGLHLAFFSGNEVFWKTRWEPSIDGTATAYRTLVSYKETHENRVFDPMDPPTWTGTWRDPRFSPPADGGRPENALTGTIFTTQCCQGQFPSIAVPPAAAGLRFWRNTPIAASGGGALLPKVSGSGVIAGGVLGYEFDEDLDNGFRPAGLMTLSSTTTNVDQRLQDYGSTYVPGTATHSLTLYRHPSGALVFGAGTVQWSWGLDNAHDRLPDGTSNYTNLSLQQATVNLLGDMGAQAALLQPGLTPATPSTDVAPPTSAISAPAAGSAVVTGTSLTVSGTAADADGHVAAVEVSIDGGTWRRATGREAWTITSMVSGFGDMTIRSRAIDDSGNIESPSIGVTVTRTCPCSLWNPATTAPPVIDGGDASAIELGVKFSSDIDGSLSGIRFYKSSANTGTHVGHLYSSTGTLLASATFTSETASGWQQVNFPSPVNVTAGTTYVASYHTDAGHYSATAGYFAAGGVDAAPLHALSNATSLNGVFQYGAGGFPISSFNATNYWVDVVLTTSPSGPDTTPPTVTGVSPPSGATGVGANPLVTVTFSEAVDPSTVNTSTIELRDAANAAVAGVVALAGSTTATFAPNSALAMSSTYTVVVHGGTTGARVTDTAGNALASDFTSAFTTAGPVACPCSLWNPATTTPPVSDTGDTTALELGVKFRSDIDGFISGVRFYKSGLNTGPHIANLWTAAGALMATATSVTETQSGWQEVLFTSPVPITAGTTYVASYHTSAGHYAATNDYFTSASVDSPPLHAPTSLAAGGNGVFSVGNSTFPTQSFRDTNYWVDVVLTTSLSGDDTTPPTVTAVSPPSGATGVGSLPLVTVTFSEAVAAATVNSNTIELRDAADTAVAGVVAYDGSTRTATFAPTNALAMSSTYTVVVHGATEPRVTDTAGNALASTFTSAFTTAAPADTTPPQISAIKATMFDSAHVTLSWTTDETATSRIDYGTDPAILTATIASLPLNTTTIIDNSFVTQHTMAVSGLQASTLYYYLITAIDHSSNATTTPAPTFMAPGPTLHDTASSDFAAGAPQGGTTYVSQSTDGEVILAPTAGTEFTGPSLSQGWIQVSWLPGGGSMFADGVLKVDGARIASCVLDANGVCLTETTGQTSSATFTGHHSLEFIANFSSDGFQHAGLGQTFSTTNEPWAIFSTLSGGVLAARTSTGASFAETGLGNGLLGAFHHYRIDWKTDSVDYYVDGTLVATHQLAVAGPMRPVAASDYNPGGGAVFVDWMRMSPYAPSGTFLSRVFDASAPVAWNGIQWKATTPAGTSVAISVRGGATATPDGTWSAFAPMSSGGQIALTSRFVQYQAVLASTNPDATPQLEDITISTGHAPVANADSAAVAPNGTNLFPASGAGSLVANDTDADAGDVLSVAAVTAPAHGSAVLHDDGSVTYTPVADYSGPDAFTYTVTDGLLTSSALVSIDVHVRNVAPVALNDGPYQVDFPTPLVVAAPGVLGNDTGGSGLTATLVAGSEANGTVTLTPSGAFTFTPGAGACGAAGFSYTAKDQSGLDSNVATVSAIIVCRPTANEDAATVLEDSGATTIAVLGNDTYPDHAQTLFVTSVTQSTNGVAAVSGSGSAVTYTPNPTFFGGDSFTYTVSDGRGGTATATVNVTVTPVNDAPSFTPGGNVTVLEDAGPQTIVNWATNVSAGPANESSQSLNFIVTSSNAALFSVLPAITPNGTLSFTTAANANGSATITVQVHDNGGTANGGSDTSAAQPFTIGVTAVNDAPSFTEGADQIKTGNVGAQTVTNWATNISAGPADESGQALNFIVSSSNTAMFATQPAVAPNGTLTYTAANAIGSAVVTVSLHDNGGTLAGGADTSAPQTFTISISKAATTTTVSSLLGQKLKFTASVAAVAPGVGTPSGTVTFKDGATALGSATLDATGNATFTPPSLSVGAHSITAVYAGAATFTGSTSAVLSQWVGVKPSLVIADVSANEGNSGTSPLTFTVTLSSAIDSPVTVDFATVDGTAVAATDYTFASGTLLFNPRETVKTITVPLIGNTVFQANRSFTVKLTNAQNADISVSVGKATIVDDDPKPVISISANSVFEGNAGSTPVTVTLTLTGATALPASASYATANVTATAGTDYIASTGTVTFAPGETVKTFVVSVLGDTLAEATEAFTVTITSTTQSTIGTKAVTISILDDDSTAWVNTSLADFTNGTVDAGAYISQTNNGEVILAPTVGSEFNGSTLDANWASSALAAGGAATFGNGGLTIDGASLVGGASGFAAGRSIEFSAKFSGAAGQNAGFTATGALAAPFAVFGTKAKNTLLARSVIAGTTLETPINGYSFTQAHKFRIDWNATTVVYWVDDKKVATHTITLSQAMRPTALDGTVGGGALFLDYMRMTPYAAAGSYTSGVFDAGAVVTWTTMAWTATTPAGTTVALKYRTGNTPTPDATWTALTPVTSSGALAGSTRYLQFVVQETTSDPSQTAVLNDVTLAFKR